MYGGAEDDRLVAIADHHDGVMNDLHYLTATEALQRFRSKELSPVELMQAVIDRAQAVEAHDQRLRRRRSTTMPSNRRATEQSYARRGSPPGRSKAFRSPLKEEAPIAGQHNTLGSLPLRDVVADQTAVFVQRILEAGGIVHARSATPEFSSAPFTCVPPVGRDPATRGTAPSARVVRAEAQRHHSPRVRRRSPPASDIGGSIRIPASSCGRSRLQAALRASARGPDLQTSTTTPPKVRWPGP